jgi:hypothetical protein
MLLAACGGDGSTASNNAPQVSSIQITATHASVAKGTSTQLSATAVYADNSHADVTADMTWTSSAPSVATVSSSGKVSAIGAGTATISGDCDHQRGLRDAERLRHGLLELPRDGDTGESGVDCAHTAGAEHRPRQPSAVHRHRHLLG